MIVGMDFGTTNSGMAVFDGRTVRLLELDAANDNPRVARTALYVTNEQDIFTGRAAINRYFEQNVGRPVKLQRVWVGEFEIFGADMYFVTDAYVWADVLSPGRLFLSFKTNLRDPDYVGTVVGQFFYPIESLVAIYLSQSKLRAEKALGQEIREIVLGRPVRFANNPKHDDLAQERLLRGAFMAGYEKVYLQREPVAAAYHYANQADKAQNILVFDFGGGTLDITVMRINGPWRRVLATGGVPIAGDFFDQKIVRAKLPHHFGEAGLYGPPGRERPAPQWVYDTFSSWQTILELQTPDNRRVLRDMEQNASRPDEIRALLSLVSGNYGLQMFDTVEKAKRELSNRYAALIKLQGPGFRVMEMISRQEFEATIRAEINQISTHLDETLQASGLRAEQIDAVIRTGGSSEIPVFQEMLQRKFGAEKVLALDIFSSVTAGLGIVARRIEQGELEMEVYTRDKLEHPNLPVTRPGVALVNLELLQQRMVAQQESQTNHLQANAPLLLLLTNDNQLLLDPTPEQLATLRPVMALQTSPPDTLVLLTSRYRFLLTTGRQLQDLARLGQSLFNRYHFAKDEAIFAIANWSQLRQAERLVIVTSLGFGRAYPAEMLRPAVEGPVPFAFDKPLAGWPLAIVAAKADDELVLLTDTGRGLRQSLKTLPMSGSQLLNRAKDETIVGVVACRPDDDLLLLTADGYGRRVPAGAIPLAPKPNSKGSTLISRRPVLGLALVLAEKALTVLTPAGKRDLDPYTIPRESDSTKSHPILPSPILALLQ